MSQAGPLHNTGGGGGGTVSTLTGNDAIAVSPISNNINLIGVNGIYVTGNDLTATLNFSAIGGGFTWNVVTNANNPVTLVASNGYICNGVNPVDFVLPASAIVGDAYWIKGRQNLWTIAQNAFQNISLGFKTTTAGVLGSMTATQVKDALEILCVTANVDFEILTCIGNPTIV